MIYGDASDIVSTLVNSLIINFHQEFKAVTKRTNSRCDKLNTWSITLIVELVNKNSDKLEKTLIYLFGEELSAENYTMFQSDVKTHLAKTKTILRNIHP